MLDKKSFSVMKKEFESHDNNRELLIKKSRDVLKLSKQIIYAVHRDSISEALRLEKDIKKEKKALEKIVNKSNTLSCVGAYKVAVSEYVEAILYLYYIKDKKILTLKDIGVLTEQYLFGIIDLTGELGRNAVKSAGKGEYNKVLEIRDIVSEIFGELLKFDFRDNDMRRKFDSVKYDLKKLEDLCLELKLKGKID